MPIGNFGPPIPQKDIYKDWGAPQWERNMGQNNPDAAESARFMEDHGVRDFGQRLYEPTADRNLGYRPTVWQDPRTVARAYQQIQSATDPATLPQWMQENRGNIEFAYKWFEDANKGAPFSEWKFLAPEDPAQEQLKQMTAPPPEWLFPQERQAVLPDYVMQGQAAWGDLSIDQRKSLLSDPNFDIASYPLETRQQILSDKSFDWSKVPAWQKIYYDISSNPYIMSSPMALAGAHAGGMFGIPGKIVGAGVGYTLGLIGGQQYNPVGSFNEQPTAVAKGMFVLNRLSEMAEQSAGFVGQFADAAIAGAQGNEQAAQAAQDMIFDPNTRLATWEAGRLTYEYSDFMGSRNWLPFIEDILNGKESVVYAEPGQDFIIGRANPVDKARALGTNPFTGGEMYVTDVQEVLRQARREIKTALDAGQDYKPIVMRLMNEGGSYVGGQLADFGLQAAADPLEYLPGLTNKALGKIADVTGNKVWAESFRSTEGPMEATRKYQTLVQTGQAAVIDPGFRVDTMGSLSRFVAGINEQGQIKAGPFNEAGLLDAPKKTNWVQEQATLTPEARAQQSAGMFYENIGAMLTMFSDPAEIGKFVKSLASNDMSQWADLGARIAQSPEMYTVLPALKEFSADKVDALTSAWDMTAQNRDTLTRLADILGQDPAKLLDDLASKGTAEQDFARIVDRLKQQDSPQARAMLDEVNSGRLTSQTLADVVKAFTGDTALPWHPDQWKALMLDQLGAHFDQWVVERLGLKDTPEAKSAFFRTAKLLKSAQSILLLGGSPGYAIQNGLSNMVHRAATGIYGYLTPKQIDTWMERFGVEPARMSEGVGMGGEVSQAPGKSVVHTEAIRDAATSAGGPLSTAQKFVSGIGKKMPFNKLSGWFEQMESKQGFVIAMRQFWSQSWRRGTGFSRMSPDLTSALQRAGYNPEHIYSAIEAGMNQTEIERALMGQTAGMQARELVHDAARRAGIPSSDAARILEKVGVLDALDAYLTKADTPDKVKGAFDRAVRRAQDEIDMTYTRDLTARTEHIAQKTAVEGATAILDAVVDTSMPYMDAWLEHYMRMGNLWDNLDNTLGEEFNLKVIESAYQQSDTAFRRVNSWQAATWQGILKNIGMLETDFGRAILGSLADSDKALSEAYRYMLSEKRAHIEKHGKNPGTREAKGDWFASQRKVNKVFDDAFAVERRSNETMRDAYAKYYTENYGPAAGEVARQMWQDVIDFRKQMTDTLNQFRAGNTIGVTSRDFYQNTYTPMIVEMGRIKQEGQAKLYQAVTGRMLPAEVAQLSQQAQVRVQTEAASVSALWDVAEGYSKMQPGNSGMYSRAAFQDKQALLGVLKKAEYGGDPTITDLTDATRKLTPEKVRSIFEARKSIKEQTFAAEDAARQARLQQVFDENAARAANRKTPENTTILQAIKKHGGIDWKYVEEVTGEKTPLGYPPGTFSKTGKMRWGLDQMARILSEEDGFNIDLNDPNDIGGVQQTIDLIQRARNGDKVYPVGHDYSIEAEAMAAREIAAAEEYLNEAAAADDMQAWEQGVEYAAQMNDLNALAELTEQLPEDAQGLPREGLTQDARDLLRSVDEGGVPFQVTRNLERIAKENGIEVPAGRDAFAAQQIIDGLRNKPQETHAEYISRVWDETVARIQQETTDYAIAEANVRAADAVRSEQAAGATAMTRQLFREKIASEFGLTDEAADAVMEVTDGRAKGWAQVNRKTPDEWYATRLADVVKGGDEMDLTQGIEPVNRRMTSDEVNNYARALVREGRDALRSAVQNEPARADRVAILDAAYQLDPNMAQTVARDTSGMLFQEVYHGSPYRFDKFSLDHMGSGEGAQAYGWGLYFAGDQNVANWYRETLSNDKVTYKGLERNQLASLPDYPNYAADEVMAGLLRYPNDPIEKVIKSVAYQNADLRDRILALNPGDFKRETGQLYRVEIPDDNYLLWDKPLSEQPQAVREAVKKLSPRDTGEYLTLDESLANQPENIQMAVKEAARRVTDDVANNSEYKKASAISRYLDSYDWSKTGSEIYQDLVSVAGNESDVLAALNVEGITLKEKLLSDRSAGSEIYDAINRDPKAASLALKDAGINGIKYLDGSSRDAGEGNFNYVIFDDNAVQVLETYYQRDVAAKGAVQFLDDGRAIIRAFEGGDVSTVVHEVAHIFRRDLEGRDLRIIEEWAEVNDGTWTRDAEEKFARGFERYLAEGDAPTPKLKAVFEKFKTWLTNIYRSITGSAIDVNLTDEVRAVFGRLIAEEPTAAPTRKAEASKVPAPDGLPENNWRVLYNNIPDVYQKNRILREIADTTRSETELRDVAIALRDVQTDTNTVWAVMKNPVATEEIRSIVRYLPSGFEKYNRGDFFWGAIEANLNKVREARGGNTLFQTAEPTDTPAFRNWFGDSKVVDENGQPLVVYHGTQKEFSQFEGISFFSMMPDYAEEMATKGFDNTAGANVMPVYLKLNRPLEVTLPTRQFSDPTYETPVIERAKAEGYDGVVFKSDSEPDVFYVTFNPEQVKSVNNRGTFDPNNPNILFQEATQPPGAYDQAADIVPTGPVLDEGWTRYVAPLLDAMRETATERLNTKQLDGGRDLSPEGQTMLRQYMRRVQGELATNKLATMRWGEKQRDFAMLNYNRRYGFDRTLEPFVPYEFFYTHSMLPWAMRAIDKPSWFANYARLRNQQNRYERDIPERLRNKIKIPAPWLPDWMGDALYIDPLANLFTPANYLRPFEQMMKDKNYQTIEAERILQEWAADETVSQSDIQQAMTHTGTTWERAMAEAATRREAEIANPFDFFRTMFGPAWYLSTPLNLAGIEVPGISTGKRGDVTNTPIANTARAVDTVTNGTWAEPIGNLIGLIGKPEEWARKQLNLPEFGEYGDYYIDRQLANMVADGLATPDQAKVAMIERTGDIFEQAKERVRMELSMRVPLAAATYAATHEGVVAGAKAFLPSLFGAGLLPAGELEYRGLKDEWNEAWKLKDAGDTEAVTRFFDEHPEYEVYLAKGKEPEERLRSYLIGAIWDGYMALGETDKRNARMMMGEDFAQMFLNKETRSYDTLDVQKLTTWARMLGMTAPRTEETAPVLDNPEVLPIQGFDPRITAITDGFFDQRKQLFPHYYTLQSQYYNLPPSERGQFLVRWPELKEYMTWKKKYYNKYPDLVPIFNGEAFKTIDTSTWPPALVDTVTLYAITGDRLPSGAQQFLKMIWMREGMPFGDFESWLENQVAPAMLNNGYQQ